MALMVWKEGTAVLLSCIVNTRGLISIHLDQYMNTWSHMQTPRLVFSCLDDYLDTWANIQTDSGTSCPDIEKGIHIFVQMSSYSSKNLDISLCVRILAQVSRYLLRCQKIISGVWILVPVPGCLDITLGVQILVWVIWCRIRYLEVRILEQIPWQGVQMNQMYFLSNRTNFVERNKLLAGYSWFHQVLKKYFPK